MTTNETQPPSPDDADREAVADVIRSVWMRDHSADDMASAVLRVLSERGRLRDGTVFDEVNAAIRRTTAYHQETTAALTRERDEARDVRDAAIARAEKAEREATGLCDQNVDLCRAIESIEAEAARLRSALRDVSAACDAGTLSDQLAANVRRIRAAEKPEGR